MRHRLCSVVVVLALLLPAPAVLGEPLIRLRTELGDVFINLTPEAAPVTVANFLNYVSNGDYENSFFHYSDLGAGTNRGIVAAGRFAWPETNLGGLRNVLRRDPIVSEFNQSNRRGTVAMLKPAGEPDGATNTWFVNITNNGGADPASLDSIDGGAAAFGTLDAESLAVVDAISQLRIEDRGDGLEQLPTLGDMQAFLGREQVVMFSGFEEFTAVTPPAAAVLPVSRAVLTDTEATVFATILNADSDLAASCRIRLASDIDAEFSYRETDPATNAPIGAIDPVLDIPGAGAKTYILSVTPRAAFANTELQFDFVCGNAAAAAGTVSAVNTLFLTSSSTAIADVVALAATLDNNGINDIEQGIGSGAFAVATTNVGAGESITVSADAGGASLPVEFFVCRTNPTSGACLSQPAPSSTTFLNSGENGTFAVFTQLTDSGATVAFDPGVNRAFVRFANAAGELRGATSVALRTVP